MKALDVIAATLLVIGGLNWGLWGLFEVDLVAAVAGGSATILATGVYTLVGLAALYQAATLPWIQKRWNVSPRLVPT